MKQIGFIAAVLFFLGVCIHTVSAVELARTEIASGFTLPVFATSPPGDTERMFVVEQGGLIRILTLSDNQVATTPFIDLSSIVDMAHNETGLLSLAFHPNYETNGYFFVFYMFDVGGGSVESRVARFRANGPNYSSASTADAESEVVLFSLPKPRLWHNGSGLAFEPRDDLKAYLYIATGDGGGAEGAENSQDLNALLGKLLRIDVDEGGEGAGTGTANYDIPPSNPNLGGAPEVWAYGLRNPYRIGFDRLNGDLYIGDVGGVLWEEINHQLGISTGGENYGWKLKEGLICNDPGTNCDPGGLTDPIFTYDHSAVGCPPVDCGFDWSGGGFAVVGGYPYRGSALPFIEGHYIYAGISGFAKTFLSNGASVSLTQNWEAQLQTINISSFAEDENGELYIIIRGLTDGEGVLYKIVPNDHDLVYVDFNASGLMKGNESNPFNTADLGIRSVAENGFVLFEGGSSVTQSSETLTLDRPMTLDTLDGSIQIGVE